MSQFIRVFSVVFLIPLIMLGPHLAWGSSHPYKGDINAEYSKLMSLEDARDEDLRILLYFARVCPDVALADRALSGALSIVGLPDRRDIVFASNMSSRDVKRYVKASQKRAKDCDRAEDAFARRVHSLSQAYDKAVKDWHATRFFRIFFSRWSLGAMIVLLLLRRR